MDVLKLKDDLIAKIKKSPKIALYAALALLCIVLLLFTGNSDSEADSLGAAVVPGVSNDYADFLEAELKSIIAKIDGVGNVEVMVTIEGTVSYEYIRDISNSDTKTDSETVIIANKEALLKQIVNPKVNGVLVICDGGDSLIIKEKVINAVSTVLDISTNKIYITK